MGDQCAHVSDQHHFDLVTCDSRQLLFSTRRWSLDRLHKYQHTARHPLPIVGSFVLELVAGGKSHEVSYEMRDGTGISVPSRHFFSDGKTLPSRCFFDDGTTLPSHPVVFLVPGTRLRLLPTQRESVPVPSRPQRTFPHIFTGFSVRQDGTSR